MALLLRRLNIVARATPVRRYPAAPLTHFARPKSMARKLMEPFTDMLGLFGAPTPLLHEFAEMGVTNGTIDGLFDEMLPAKFLTKMAQLHPMHINVHATCYEVKADVPGMAPQDIRVEVMPGRMLKVSGDRTTSSTFPDTTTAPKTQQTPEVYESFNFERSFGLPSDADVEAVTAVLDKGVLTITVPRRVVEQPAPRRVAVHRHPPTGARKPF
ncbi:hypothetical protein HYH02_007893 [Chlamydomonas schloesseri]|uniref:SHSP domain-containing protein n=1 Tax=Chlamydomonas schloesseri TaxID=2026947 RepID=A0A835WGM0_9CHLO|nr:hypothetical protein HYH02_007893 [Chlamydomonas schloesseri]|eukprot:KAG2447147.1 hypothetical protein HYH02_007893 [Chlamydomonas schloesseri]